MQSWRIYRGLAKNFNPRVVLPIPEGPIDERDMECKGAPPYAISEQFHGQCGASFGTVGADGWL